MLPSLHDWFLISYEVHCEARRITLRARPDTRPDPAPNPASDRVIIFDGVEGYHFWDDAFDNIIFSLTEISIDKVLSDYRSEIEEYRVSGALGPWADDLNSASAVLGAKGVRGFALSSSYGLSGWLLAKEAVAKS
jgi:hypothetical protein